MIKKLGAWILSFVTILTLLPGQVNAGERENLVTTAKKYIGIKYAWGGTSPSTGFDCSGFTSYVYKQSADVKLPRMTSDQYSGGKAVKKADLEQGDLVFFTTYKAGASHAGIYVGSGNFIHASSSKGITISSINDPYYWGSKYLGARRYIEDDKAVAELAVLPKGQYHDVPATYWAYKSITTLSKKGVMNGYEYSQFKPGKSVTRAEAATMVANALKLKPSTKQSQFKDVSNSFWGVGPINAVKEAGILGGYPDGTFKPNQEMTREEIAALIAKTFVLKDKGTENTFPDVTKDNWAYHAIQRLNENSIASGFKDKTFKPKNETSRAEFSTFLDRSLTKLAVK